MLTINSSKRFSYCDGVPRRSFLKVGSLGIAGFSLADLFHVEARAGTGFSNHTTYKTQTFWAQSGQFRQDLGGSA